MSKRVNESELLHGLILRLQQLLMELRGSSMGGTMWTKRRQWASMDSSKARAPRTIARGSLRSLRLEKIWPVSWALLGLAGPTSVQLVFMILAARVLGASLAGNFFLVVSTATIASSFIGLGAGGLVLRDAARNPLDAPLALGRSHALTALTFPFLLPIVVAVSYSLTHGAIPLLTVLAIAAAELVPMRVMTNYWSLFIAREQQVHGSLLICTMPLCRLLSVVAVVAMPAFDQFQVFSTAYFAGSLVALTGGYLYVRSVVGEIPFTFKGFDTANGISFAMTWLNQALQVEADKLIVSLYTTPATVAIYAVASRLMDGAFMPARALKTVFQSRLFRRGASGHTETLRLTLKVLPITIGYGFLAWLGFVFAAPFIVNLFGPEFARLLRILPILGALPLLRTIADFGAEIFLASNRPNIQALTQTFTTVLRIGVGFMLISQFELDGAIATALTVNLISGAVLWLLVRHFSRASRTSH